MVVTKEFGPGVGIMSEEPVRTYQLVVHLDNHPVRYIQHTIPNEWVFLAQQDGVNIYQQGGLTLDHKQLIGCGLFEYLKPQLQKEPNTLMVESAYSDTNNKIFLSNIQIGSYRVIYHE